MLDALVRRQRVVVADILPEVEVPTDPDAIAGEERRLVCVDERLRELIVLLEVRITAGATQSMRNVCRHRTAAQSTASLAIWATFR